MNLGRHSLRRIALVATLIAALTGCERADAPVEAPRYAVETPYTEGPITLTLRLERQQMTILDTVALVLDADLPQHYRVRFPVIEEGAPDTFSVADEDESRPQLGDDGRVTLTHRYVLEPTVAGAYTIPSLTVTFTPTGEGEAIDIVTDAVAVEVAPLLADDEAFLILVLKFVDALPQLVECQFGFLDDGFQPLEPVLLGLRAFGGVGMLRPELF